MDRKTFIREQRDRIRQDRVLLRSEISQAEQVIEAQTSRIRSLRQQLETIESRLKLCDEVFDEWTKTPTPTDPPKAADAEKLVDMVEKKQVKKRKKTD